MNVRFIPVLSALLLCSSATAQMKENALFRASLTSFQTSNGGNGWHYLTATVHLTNLTKKPLILGFDGSKTSGSDDQGHRYGFISIRGIGSASGNTADPKFVLAPGASGDALVELRGRIDARAVRGTSWDLSLVFKELSNLASGQIKIGSESTIDFNGIKNGFFAAPMERTVDAGPFSATLTRSKISMAGRWRICDVTLVLKNTSDKPIILGYESASSFGTDDKGFRWGYGTAGTHDTSFSGIGLVTSAQADPQLKLTPGESKEVKLKVMRANSREEAGTTLTYYVALQALEILPSGQIRGTRQYSLTFPGLSALK